MKHGIYTDNDVFEFPTMVGDFSAGRSVSVTDRFSKNTGKSQTLARRNRLQAMTYTVQYTLNRTTGANLEILMYKAEEMNGKSGSLFWHNRDYGLVVVESVGISCILDVDGVAECTFAFDLREGRMPNIQRSVSIKTQK